MSSSSASVNCDRLRVAFAGTPEFAAVALDALIQSQHEVVGVLTQPDRPAGRGRKLTHSAVKQRALAADIPVQQPVSLRNDDALAELASLSADVLVVAAYGIILPQTVLDLPPLGCLNIHGSLLPRWRGAAPIHRAILAGDTHTGVCIMQMDAGLDTGDVLLERQLAIGADETVAQLHDRLAALGAAALLDALPVRCNGTLQPVVQPEEGLTYAEKLTKAEAQLDFTESSLLIHRKVRAFNPWPVAEARLRDERVRIWQSRLLTPDVLASRLAADNVADQPAGTIVQVSPGAIVVRTGDGLIELLQLQWPGKKMQNSDSFSQGRDLHAEQFATL
ncbi:methionyl-tRNA formyltransferase [Granulosicoccus antarcticus]|uniref:Methionyl-tRNA formyltransferase n=1 Tax=Granulosicoccus antarcticus IMCC3135 TaxID=1192854 RepID=A0A2Z2NWE1_9GAMM|nr:methionyl-tRNA formyltransferase [Granulosicoccus antarcticus]ASJ71464.1 Methionyl-tRNA formyltransferase [Granulosicoccus antarcticus IMCC3135]